MARWMSEDGGYRAAVKIKTVTRNPTGSGPAVPAEAVEYIGPYDQPAQAKAAVTGERRVRGGAFIDGWIERATWERVD